MISKWTRAALIAMTLVAIAHLRAEAAFFCVWFNDKPFGVVVGKSLEEVKKAWSGQGWDVTEGMCPNGSDSEDGEYEMD